MNTRLSVSLIVLNWNGKHHLERCLPSLIALDYPTYEIIVVDNGSTDGSIVYVTNAYPTVRLIETGFNLGYAGGMNVGITHSRAEVVILLNNDIIVPPQWLGAFMAGLETDPRIGIAGCKLFFSDGVTLQHAGGWITYPRGISGHFGYREPDRGTYDTLVDMEYVTGAAMAIRRVMLDEVGLLDINFFPVYYEDVDICYRARDAGWRVVYVPGASLIHMESATIGRDSCAYLRFLNQGRLRFLLKHMPPQQFMDEFIPAEQNWLERDAGALERRVMASVYKLSLLTVAEVYAAKSAAEVSFAVLQQVLRALSDLSQRARSLSM